MSQPGSIQNAVPPGDDWISRRLKALEDKVAQLSTARSGNAMTINGGAGLKVTGGGSLAISDGGALKVVDSSTGNVILFVGQFPLNDGSGRVQGGMVLTRADGTPALTLSDADTMPGHTFHQGLAWRDTSLHVVVTEDPGGMGLARPYIPAAWADIANPTNTTASASYVGMAWADVAQQHPQLRASVLCQTPAGTVGSIRITVGGTQIGSPVSVPSGSFGLFIIGPAPWPAGMWTHEAFQTVQLEAKVTSGAGAVGVRGVGLWSTQT